LKVDPGLKALAFRAFQGLSGPFRAFQGLSGPFRAFQLLKLEHDGTAFKLYTNFDFNFILRPFIKVGMWEEPGVAGHTAGKKSLGRAVQVDLALTPD